jgi:hypothetical protein
MKSRIREWQKKIVMARMSIMKRMWISWFRVRRVRARARSMSNYQLPYFKWRINGGEWGLLCDQG